MGQIIGSTKKKISSAYIQQLPGNSGYPRSKKQHISVYTDKQILYIKIFPDMTGDQLKKLVKLRIGKDVKLTHKNCEINYELGILKQGFNEKSLIKAELISLYEKPSKTSNVSSRLTHRRVGSAQIFQKNYENLDFSMISAPEAGFLKKKATERFF